MPSLTLFQSPNHKNILLEDFGRGLAVQANQHLIIHENSAILLDPGGHKVYSKVLGETFAQLGRAKLEHLFFSHQDPDIVAAANGWLMTTDATGWAPSLWIRFIPHFGLDNLVADRLKPIPDNGMILNLAGCDLMFIPAHFLHSPGNLQVYDPVSKILYSGDLGASLGMDYQEVPDFDAHLKYMEGFHKRYMTSNRAMHAWAGMVRELDIEIIAPQHGALFRGRGMVQRFIDWCDELTCGVDLLPEQYTLPHKN
ncbi:MAG: FprA family A-type flavoprotein [Deltaproteobacteria bacterium]|nr:FprA family A-type flavoprotein [Deltaproteobacteria bacterium]